MNRSVIKLGTVIWNLTPFLPVRKMYLALFTKLVRGRKVMQTVEGFNFELDLAENIDVCVLLEKFERDVVNTINTYCRPGWHVLDIGANIGAHTLRLARSVGSAGVVHAFEPTEYAYDKLTHNIAINGALSIHPFRLALSNTNETNRVIDFRSSWQTDGSSVSGLSTVDFMRLDDWCETQRVKHIDMIKIDVDGNEFPVFDGGRRLLSTCRPIIIMEVGAWHFVNSDKNPIHLLADLGYQFWDISKGARYSSPEEIRRRLPDEDSAMSFSINVIAAPALEKQ
jgi:FkbM family methyltransferase